MAEFLLQRNIFRKLKITAISSSQWNVSMVSIEFIREIKSRLMKCLISEDYIKVRTPGFTISLQTRSNGYVRNNEIMSEIFLFISNIYLKQKTNTLLCLYVCIIYFDLVCNSPI